jgi:hypothetical protein
MDEHPHFEILPGGLLRCGKSKLERRAGPGRAVVSSASVKRRASAKEYGEESATVYFITVPLPESDVNGTNPSTPLMKEPHLHSHRLSQNRNGRRISIPFVAHALRLKYCLDSSFAEILPEFAPIVQSGASSHSTSMRNTPPGLHGAGMSWVLEYSIGIGNSPSIQPPLRVTSGIR